MQVLMCAPQYFDVPEKDKYGNLHMDPDNKPDRSKALKDWKALVRVYHMLGLTVHLIDPAPGFVDMPFTANAGFTFKRASGQSCVLLSNFRPERRRGEKQHFESFFRQKLHYSTINTLDEIYFEGAGDTIPFGDVVLMGHGFRTSKEMVRELQAIIEQRVIPLELKKPTIGDKILYHLDTTMIVIDDPHAPIIIAYKDAFTEDSWLLLTQEVRRRGGNLLEASYEDAAGLALNAVVIKKNDLALDMKKAVDNETLMGHCANIQEALRDTAKDFKGVIVTSETASDNLLREINARGYYPVTLPLHEFLKSGGGAFCLTKILPR